MDATRAGVGAIIGALVAIVAGFLPFVSFVAPLLGGAVAGSIQRSGPRAGAVAGALVGVVLALLGVVLVLAGPLFPAVPAAVVLGPWARAFGLGMVDSLSVLVGASTVLLVVVGGVGGAIGGAVAGPTRSGRSSRGASDR